DSRSPRSRAGFSLWSRDGPLAARRQALAVIDAVVEVEGAAEDVHEAPDGYHHEEADDAPEHELLSGLALLLIMAARDEVLEHAPDEHDEREGEDERHEHVIDDVDEARTEVLDVRCVDLRGREEREREGGSDVSEFLH